MPAKFPRFVTRTALQANCLCGQTFGKLRPDFRVIGILELEWMSQRRFLGRISLPESQIDS